MDNNENFHESILLDDTHKFLPKSNTEELKVKIQFNGLSKEEVMATAKDPQWVRLRWILLILFWVIWIGMLVAAAFIIVFTDKCPCIPKQMWYQKELVYQVDVAYFQDSNGDGVGDLGGLLDRLKYLKENVGAGALCLASSLLNKKNIAEVDSKYLVNTDIDKFRKELKSNDMYVIIDIPYGDVSSNNESLNTWLNKRGFDGVRIVDIPESNLVDLNLITNLIEKVKKISQETFENKFISFYPLTSEKLSGTNSLFHPFSLSESPNTNYEAIKALTNKTLANKKCECNPEWPLLIKLPKNSDLTENNMKIAHGVNLLLKGTPFIQYGDEINLEDTTPRYMKWNDKLNCGFSNNQTSLIEQIKCSPNVEEETSHGAGNRLIRLYQNLKDLRRKNSFLFGDVILPDSSLVQIDENLLAFVREAEKFDGYLIAANIGKSSKKFDFKNMFKLTDYKETGKSIQLPDTAKVVYFDWVGTKKHNDFEIENKIQTDRIYLNPGEFLVLSFTR